MGRLRQMNQKQLKLISAGGLSAGVLFAIYALVFYVGFSLRTEFILLGASIFIGMSFLIHTLNLGEKWLTVKYAVLAIGANCIVFGFVFIFFMSQTLGNPTLPPCSTATLLPVNVVCLSYDDMVKIATAISVVIAIGANIFTFAAFDINAIENHAPRPTREIYVASGLTLLFYAIIVIGLITINTGLPRFTPFMFLGVCAAVSLIVGAVAENQYAYRKN